MNLQEILAPIEALFMWTFSILKAGGNGFNLLLIALISVAMIYWILKLGGFEKSEVPNR